METQNDVSNKIVGKEEVERLIEDYERKDTSMSCKLDYLRSANTIAKVRIISFPKEGETRVDAIMRQFKAYSLMKPQNYSRFTFCIEFAMRHPLMMEEEKKLREFCMMIYPPKSKSYIYTAVDESLDDKILVTIIASN